MSYHSCSKERIKEKDRTITNTNTENREHLRIDEISRYQSGVECSAVETDNINMSYSL